MTTSLSTRSRIVGSLLLSVAMAACGGGSNGAAAHNFPTVISVINDLTHLPSGIAAGGDPVTITGTNFLALGPLPTVKFSGIAASNVVVQSDAVITANTPPGSTLGLVDVTVAGNGLIGTLAQGFRFLAPPTGPGDITLLWSFQDGFGRSSGLPGANTGCGVAGVDSVDITIDGSTQTFSCAGPNAAGISLVEHAPCATAAGSP